ncbi:hypothetical protein ANN_26494 [Periplaneta americana]|uniref:Uncharacterized protein n=1 Tax=Periplaneta americana TaxID=6978 RepID=A0ABQ8RYX8_PERAM|nr:hypothetical protein ANN_26494 [Periplaneta americana]
MVLTAVSHPIIRGESRKWVPKNLTSEHKMQRLGEAPTFLQPHHDDGDEFLDRIVTGDETWISHFTPETKQQSMHWRHSGSPVRTKFKQTLSNVLVHTVLYSSPQKEIIGDRSGERAGHCTRIVASTVVVCLHVKTANTQHTMCTDVSRLSFCIFCVIIRHLRSITLSSYDDAEYLHGNVICTSVHYNNNIYDTRKSLRDLRQRLFRRIPAN